MKYFLAKNTKRGFTLIELLVVIAIIGILASVVLASLSTSRSAARDAKRLAEAKQFQTALELFRNNNNNRYPCINGSTTTVTGCAGGVVINNSTPTASATSLLAAVNFPATVDPGYPNASGITYRLRSNDAGNSNNNPDRTSYTLRVRLEGGKTNSAGQVIPPGGYCSISVGVGHANYNNTTAGQYYPCF